MSGSRHLQPPLPSAHGVPREALRDTNAARVVSMTPGLTPGPGGTVYPANMVDFCGHDANYVENVRFTGQKAMVLRSLTQHVHNGGSGGVCEPIGHAPQVRAGGSPVIRHGDWFWMDNRRTVGEAQFVRDQGIYAPPPDSDPMPGPVWDARMSGSPGQVPSAATDGSGNADPNVRKVFIEILPDLFEDFPLEEVVPRPAPKLPIEPPTPAPPAPEPMPGPAPGQPLPPGLRGPGPSFPLPAPQALDPKPSLGPQPVPPPRPVPDSRDTTRVSEQCPSRMICFYPGSDLDWTEYQKQLDMQNEALNGKNPQGYLADRQNFITNRAQIEKDKGDAQAQFWKDYRARKIDGFRQANNYNFPKAEAAYKQSVDGKAALHVLDTVAGGDAKKLAPDPGGGPENSQIGATMRQRVGEMDAHARLLAARHCPQMRVRLAICGTKAENDAYKKELDRYEREHEKYEQDRKRYQEWWDEEVRRGRAT